MSWDHTGLKKVNNSYTSDNYNYLARNSKPIEMYVFIDPLCPECWNFEAYLRKFSLEYGRFFTVRHIVSTPVNRDYYYTKATKKKFNETPISNPWAVALAIKAAEIQGKRAGNKFIRKLQEYLFLHRVDIYDEKALIEIASDAGLDMDEFTEDMHSSTARKAYQGDVQLTHEMEIEITPTIVFFNHNNDDQGVKLAGLYPYEVYEYLLQETLKMNPIPSEKPPLEEFLKKYNNVESKEISIVYDWSLTKTERELKKLQFKRRVNRIENEDGSYWRYNK